MGEKSVFVSFNPIKINRFVVLGSLVMDFIGSFHAFLKINDGLWDVNY